MRFFYFFLFSFVFHLRFGVHLYLSDLCFAFIRHYVSVSYLFLQLYYGIRKLKLWTDWMVSATGIQPLMLTIHKWKRNRKVAAAVRIIINQAKISIVIRTVIIKALKVAIPAVASMCSVVIFISFDYCFGDYLWSASLENKYLRFVCLNW